jgi:hypothetical protein
MVSAITIGSGNYRDQRNNLNLPGAKALSSSILEGRITAVDQNQQLVFTTSSNGDFILNNLQNTLNTGDKLKIQIKRGDASGILSGTILEINDSVLEESTNRSLNLRNISTATDVKIDTSSKIINFGTNLETKLLTNNIKDFIQKASSETGIPAKDLVNFGIKNAALFQSMASAEVGSSFIFKALDVVEQSKSKLSYNIDEQGRFIVEAKLIKQNPFGSNILITPLGLLSISKDIMIPKDHSLQLLLENIINNAKTGAIISDVVNKSTDFLRKIQNYWPALTKLTKFLKLKSDSKEFEEEVKKMFPGTDSDMLYKIIKYAEAIKSGNISNIISKETLEKFKSSGAEDIINELADDFFELQKIYSSNNDLDNWQTMLVPIFDGDAVQHTKIFTRKSSKDGIGQIRLIIELTLESDGEMQLDGLVSLILGINNKSTVQKFDLVIRTLKPLDKKLRSGIQEIFINNQKIIGISGNLRFEQVDIFKVRPLDDVKNNKQKGESGDGYIA